LGVTALKSQIDLWNRINQTNRLTKSSLHRTSLNQTTGTMNKPNKTKSANLLRIGLLMSTMKKRIERLKM
jgi:hypothetical protein